MILVRYLATPIDLFLELQDGLDAFQRELQLADIDGADVVSREVVEGMVVHRDSFVEVRAALHDQAIAARDAGRVTADLAVEFPIDAAATVVAITRAARGADDAAAVGHLLNPPVGPRARHLQQWMLEQVARQLDGQEPVPYEAPAAEAT